MLFPSTDGWECCCSCSISLNISKSITPCDVLGNWIWTSPAIKSWWLGYQTFSSCKVEHIPLNASSFNITTFCSFQRLTSLAPLFLSHTISRYRIACQSGNSNSSRLWIQFISLLIEAPYYRFKIDHLLFLRIWDPVPVARATTTIQVFPKSPRISYSTSVGKN